MSVPYGNDSKPENPITANRKVLHRTHFRRRPAGFAVWQWYWSKQANNGKIIADGAEGYDTVNGAMHGYFVGEGIEFDPGMPPPEDYVIQKFHSDHWVITKYGNDEESQQIQGE